MAKNHQQLAEQILPLVGGKENIRGVCHCQTRLRFTLVDGFLQGASGWMPPVFVLSESACGLFFWRIIRFNTQHPVADPHMGLNQMQRMCA